MKRVEIWLTLWGLILFWTRFLSQVFSPLLQNKSLKFWLLMSGFFPVTVLMIWGWLFADATNLTSPVMQGVNTWGFRVYCGGVLLLLPLLFLFMKEKKIWMQIFVGIVSLGFWVWSGQWSWLLGGIGYYLILAYVEELFKFSITHLHHEKYSQNSVSSILLVAIVVAFSFSLAENIFAFGIMMLQGSELSSGFLLGRGLFTGLIHVVSTGLIALIILKNNIKNKSLETTNNAYQKSSQKTDFQLDWGQTFLFFWALLGGFWVHVVYNLSLYFQQGWISILLGVVAFAGLGYLFFHLDELYENA